MLGARNKKLTEFVKKQNMIEDQYLSSINSGSPKTRTEDLLGISEFSKEHESSLTKDKILIVKEVMSESSKNFNKQSQTTDQILYAANGGEVQMNSNVMKSFQSARELERQNGFVAQHHLMKANKNNKLKGN